MNNTEILMSALKRIVATDDAHATIHAADGDDIARMIEYAAAFDNARYAIALCEASQARVVKPVGEVVSSDYPLCGEQDSMYESAVGVVQKHQKASISLVQRVLKIGYNRAARLIEKMAEDGLITSHNNGSYSLATITDKGAA